MVKLEEAGLATKTTWKMIYWYIDMNPGTSQDSPWQSWTTPSVNPALEATCMHVHVHVHVCMLYNPPRKNSLYETLYMQCRSKSTLICVYLLHIDKS